MKKIRLEREYYSQPGQPCHVTICSRGGNTIFTNREFTLGCMALLESLCNKYDFKLYAYCFMPEHLHFTIAVESEKSIIGLVQAFKSLATKESYRFGLKGKIFQTRFYDHFPRTWEDFEKHVRYILENPVRKGLVQSPEDYPFSKCFY